MSSNTPRYTVAKTKASTKPTKKAKPSKPTKKMDKPGTQRGPKVHTNTRRPGGPPAANEAQQDAERTVRRHEALKLKIAGATYEQIALQMGVSKATAYYDVHEALGEYDEEMRKLAPRVRDLILRQVDAVQINMWPAMQRGDTKAAGVVLRCIDTRARVTGTYAPAKVAFTDPSGNRPFQALTREQIVEKLRQYVEQEQEDSNDVDGSGGSDA
jgi:hypothetical protein